MVIRYLFIVFVIILLIQNTYANQIVKVNCHNSLADINCYEKKDGKLEKILGPFKGNIGKNGSISPDKKIEGDMKTPTGTYRILMAFGYNKKINTKMSYRQVTENDYWDCDINSKTYNSWVNNTKNLKNYEILKRKDNLYKYGLIIDHNMNPAIPGKGSAIFVHVERGAGKPTAGCISLGKKDIMKVINWLNYEEYPVIIIEGGKI